MPAPWRHVVACPLCLAKSWLLPKIAEVPSGPSLQGRVGRECDGRSGAETGLAACDIGEAIADVQTAK